MQASGSKTRKRAWSGQVSRGKGNYGICSHMSVWSNFLPAVFPTIDFEEPVAERLLSTATKFLSLVDQSLLLCIVSPQNHSRTRPRVDGELRTIVLPDLRGVM